MNTKFRVTFATVTEESAAEGDVSESGWYHTGGWKCPATDEPSAWTLREVVKNLGRCFEDSGSWFSSVDADIDYRTGEQTSYSVHPPEHITASSYARVRRVLDINR